MRMHNPQSHFSNLDGFSFRVYISAADVLKFAKTWPCLGESRGFSCEFYSQTGDLVDMTGDHEKLEQGGLNALVDDACKFGLQQLGKFETYFLKYGEKMGPSKDLYLEVIRLGSLIGISNDIYDELNQTCTKYRLPDISLSMDSQEVHNKALLLLEQIKEFTEFCMVVEDKQKKYLEAVDGN